MEVETPITFIKEKRRRRSKWDMVGPSAIKRSRWDAVGSTPIKRSKRDVEVPIPIKPLKEEKISNGNVEGPIPAKPLRKERKRNIRKEEINEKELLQHIPTPSPSPIPECKTSDLKWRAEAYVKYISRRKPRKKLCSSCWYAFYGENLEAANLAEKKNMIEFKQYVKEKNII